MLGLQLKNVEDMYYRRHMNMKCHTTLGLFLPIIDGFLPRENMK